VNEYGYVIIKHEAFREWTMLAKKGDLLQADWFLMKT